MMKALVTLLLLIVTASHAADTSLFDQKNLAAWCIVPFDAKKRGPEERAAMLEKLGFTNFVYDYRAEHVPQWEDELNALKKHHVNLLGWWFPGSVNDEAKKALDLFKRYGVHPQLWISGGGGAIGVKDEADQKSRVEKEITRFKAICEAAAPADCSVGIYNHGGWGGEPENMIAVCEGLKAQGIKNIGIIYNLHHGHGHLDRLDKVLPRLLPHLLCLNLNGMDIDGEAKGRKILPLGAGTQDVKVLRQIRASGYSGPIGILNHTDNDAEGRLQDNLDGLRWLVPQLDDAKPGARPKYRTWDEKAQSKAPRAENGRPESVASMNAEFGKSLKGGWMVDGNQEYSKLPFTVECRARLDGKNGFNILVASEMKASATHWEFYTMAKSGTLALYMPGRGGNYDSRIDVCDGKWHDLLASADDKSVVLWIDGKQVFEQPARPLTGKPQPGQLAFGRLVEGTIGCDGVIDDVRITRGVMKPRKTTSPRQRMDNTLGLWSFDNLDSLLPPPAPKPAAFTPTREPLDKSQNIHWQEFVNRERVFDFYGKQALQFMKQKPLPELIPQFPGLDGGQQGHWGNQNDQVTWKDGRFAASDLGSVFSCVFKGAGLTIPKAVCVNVGELSYVFDPETLSFPVSWTGGFIKLSDHRHGFMGGATMEGKAEGKTNKTEDGDDETKVRRSYRGFYRVGREVVFSYSGEDGSNTLRALGSSRGIASNVFKGGPAQWPKWIETKGELGTQTPFATDRITIPFQNPYGTLFFITAHDFFSDGTAAIATMTGEVWLVKGIDEKLEKLRWKRFATGLHQPLGMKIVKDKLYVLGRDQITCLHDLNGDDEADFYECVTNAMQTSPGGHDFIVGLETDKDGRWYFASGNQGVCRITGRDKLELLATGFRNPNGLGISADGRFISTSVQEGDWTPSSAVCQIELDHDLGAHFGAGGPKNGQTPAKPLLQMPRGEDNSCSSQAFVSGKEWASLSDGGNNLVHLSSGGGSAWLVMRQNVKGQWQGAAVKISGNFDSGPQCARFNPRDGHLYVNGMQGWGSYTPKDGCFQRVRFTGGATPVPVAFEARDNGVLLRFNQPLDAKVAVDASKHFAQCWNYHYGPQYGSPEFSVRYADTPGHDPLEVRSARLLEGGKALFLEIPQIVPANTVHLHVGVTAERAHDIFMTAHALAEPFTNFPGYTKIAKTNHAEQTDIVMPAPSKPNPWAKGDPGCKIVIEAALGLQYVQKELRVKAGEQLSLTFKNPDVVPHNWMLSKPGTLQAIGNLANLMITDPQGLAKHYVPDSKDVIVYTDMTNPKGEFTIHFTAPKEKGDYPYLCTFPGHWMVMNGVMKVQ